ncbi:alpha-1,4-N-acetylglucosaminyltransferase-like [Bufo gargarizans]|uniref:alpha-1,4-N-acetylglucosaminyltransferase-like n=1 Tax=Bufo gargarizans TaxID=30331 RepID=UPI001CF3EAD4|nr:alpha-1,4-N-acetylglucosaminyltransferase-like [Bufo gargarizans]
MRDEVSVDTSAKDQPRDKVAGRDAQSHLYRHTMTFTKHFRIFHFILLLIGSGFLYKIIYQRTDVSYLSYIFSTDLFENSWNKNTPVTSFTSKNTEEHIKSNEKRLEDLLNQGDGIIFLETTDTMKPKPLVLCSIESAARVYHNRPIVFFMKGLEKVESDVDEKNTKRHFPTLSSLDNIYIFPLIFNDIFYSTPFLPWYNKTNPKQEKYWIHTIADSCRLALIWKYGGIYMDTDIISIQPIPQQNFLAAEHLELSSNGVFGFSSQHNFTWMCMEDFVQNYNGKIWGFQGPHLFTRVLKKWCSLQTFKGIEDISCGNISYLNPQRFYPIPYISWRKYYEVWQKLPTFNYSYALHLWNYMNNEEQRTMVPGSNMLVEHLYKQHCPSTYGAIQRNESLYL